jgi:hypothetical protein
VCNDFGMIELIRALFWLWVIGSLLILAYRWWRKRSDRSSDEPTAPAPPDPTDHLRTSPPLSPMGDASPASSVSPTTPVAPPVASDLPPPVGSAPRAVDGGSIFDAPTAWGEAAPAPSGRPIAELVSGIRMPCDLVPVADHTPRAGTRESVSFSTRGHDPVEVGRAMGEELRRLGFELEPVTTMRVRATKPEGVIEVEVHPDPSLVEHSGLPAFPSVLPGTVAVELWR